MVENLFGKNAKPDNLKTFDGDGSTLEKLLKKTIDANNALENINHSIALKK